MEKGEHQKRNGLEKLEQFKKIQKLNDLKTETYKNKDIQKQRHTKTETYKNRDIQKQRHTNTEKNKNSNGNKAFKESLCPSPQDM